MSMTKRLLDEIVEDLDFLDEQYQYQQFLEEEMEVDFFINQFFSN